MRDLQREELDPGLYGDGELAALRFAERLTTDSLGVTDAEFARLRGHFGEEEVVEIAAVAGLFNYFNRFNNALATPPTEPSPYVG